MLPVITAQGMMTAATEVAPNSKIFADDAWEVGAHYWYVKGLNSKDFPQFLATWNANVAPRIRPLTEQQKKAGCFSPSSLDLSVSRILSPPPARFLQITQKLKPLFANVFENPAGEVAVKDVGIKFKLQFIEFVKIIHKLTLRIFETSSKESEGFAELSDRNGHSFLVVYGESNCDISVCYEKLGQGRWGTVFSFISLIGKTFNALKFPRKEKENKANALEAFERETEALKDVSTRIQHISIQSPHKFVFSNGFLIFAVSKLYGNNLMTFFEKNPHLSKPVLIELCNQLLELALLLAKNNVIHGDIKPENIVLRSQTERKLILIDWSASLCFPKTVRPTPPQPYLIRKNEVPGNKHKQTVYADFADFFIRKGISQRNHDRDETQEGRLSRKLQFDLQRVAHTLFIILNNGTFPDSSAKEVLLKEFGATVADLYEAMMLGTVDIYGVFEIWKRLIPKDPENAGSAPAIKLQPATKK